MENTVNDLIEKLNNLPDEIKNKPVRIICPNGIRVYPEIKTKHESSFDFTSEIEEIVLTWD